MGSKSAITFCNWKMSVHLHDFEMLHSCHLAHFDDLVLDEDFHGVVLASRVVLYLFKREMAHLAVNPSALPARIRVTCRPSYENDSAE